MQSLILVAAGGAFGAVMRYLLGGWSGRVIGHGAPVQKSEMEPRPMSPDGW